MTRLPGLCLALTCLALPGHADPALLTVTGTGEVSVVPDIARLSVGVSARGDSAGAAMSEMNSAARAVLEFLLTDEGLDSADVQTGQLSLSAQYPDGQYGGAEVTGYEARTSVDVVLRDLTHLGGLLDSVIGEGANSLGALSFDLANPGPSLDAARRLAVADAQARAALYAEAAGLELGALVSISEGGASAGPMPMMAAYSGREAAVAEGSVNLSASVTMVYQLGE